MVKDLLVNKVKERLQRLIGEDFSPKKKRKILIGFSGGKDSTFLLFAFWQLKDHLNLKLFAFHLNHLLRGEEAERDEKFCREFCRRLKIPLVVKRYDVKRYAKRNKISLEEAGRLIRYRFFEEVRKKKGLDFIALGHNATDNCETMLLALIKGQGLSGIAGIPEKRDRIIRPLIGIKMEEIEGCLKENNIPYVFDITNLSLSHPRNYIRQIILPFLKEINPNLEETMHQTAQILQEEDAYQKKVVEEKIGEGIRKVKGGYLIDKKIFLSYNLAIRRRLLKEMFADMSFLDIEKVIGLMKKSSGKEVFLKGGLWAVSEPEAVFIGTLPQTKGEKERVLKMGLNQIEDMGLELELRVRDKGITYGQKMMEYFDWNKVFPPLFLRRWRPGDFLVYEEGIKKLQDLFVDCKIPKRLKVNIPILFDQKGILWVLGLRRANRAKVSEETKRILEVKIRKWRENPIRKI